MRIIEQEHWLFFQDILNRTRSKEQLYWFKDLKTYYTRSEWELYDLKHDGDELNNLAYKNEFKKVFKDLYDRLLNWQNITNDPWICSPHAVLEDKGLYHDNVQCLSLDNMI